MASNSETGHAVNLTNAELVINLVIEMGPLYTPGNSDISVVNLQTKRSDSDSAQTGLIASAGLLRTKLHLRFDVWADMEERVKRIVNEMGSMKIDKRTKDEVKVLKKRITGENVKKHTAKLAADDAAGTGGAGGTSTDAGGDADAVGQAASVSQQGYARTKENFVKIIEILRAIPVGYTPSDVALSVAGLDALVLQMTAAEGDVANRFATYVTKKNLRDELMYNKETGLLAAMTMVKSYVKGLPKAVRALWLKRFTAIKFRSPSKD